MRVGHSGNGIATRTTHSLYSSLRFIWSASLTLILFTIILTAEYSKKPASRSHGDWRVFRLAESLDFKADSGLDHKIQRSTLAHHPNRYRFVLGQFRGNSPEVLNRAYFFTIKFCNHIIRPNTGIERRPGSYLADQHTVINIGGFFEFCWQWLD
jgi:hypothetical protein